MKHEMQTNMRVNVIYNSLNVDQLLQCESYPELIILYVQLI